MFGNHQQKSLSVLITVIVATQVGTLKAQADDVRQKIDEMINPLIEKKTHVGVVVGIINQESRQVFGYGKVNLKSDTVPDGDTIFEIGSITKVFTTLLLADMSREGLVKLIDPVQSCLPDQVTMPKWGDTEITLLDLATHTSGLPRVQMFFIPADPKNPYADYTAETLYQFLSKHKLRRAPGKYDYSNLGMGLLGHALACKANTSYEQIIIQHICEPLGMKDTRITLNDQQRTRLAPGHTAWKYLGLLPGRPTSNWDFKALAGCGAIRSTADDMLTFLAANMGLTKTKLLPAMLMCHKKYKQTDAEFIHICMGWHTWMLYEHSEEFIFHNGGTGGYCSFLAFSPKSKKGVIVLTNSAKSVDGEGIAIIKLLIADQ
ncbi:MAG: beta-lactamase family protein [Planctomycetota bacterium]|nr:MAG: beta-lactamase family protein [Planctomycetota bacterium]